MAVSVEDIRNTIIEVLTEIDDTIDADALKDDVPFREQLELDSMDMLDVVLGLRRRYKLPIREFGSTLLAVQGTAVNGQPSVSNFGLGRVGSRFLAPNAELK